MSIYAFTNAQIILLDQIIPQGTVVVQGKRIIAVKKEGRAPRGSIKVNARGNFIASGFIDLHIHGEIAQICAQQVKGGTTGFLATLHPAKPKILLANISQAVAQSRTALGPKVLGLRLEGPFLNRAFCGALPPAALRRPNIHEARRIIQQAGCALKMVILAPELPGAIGLIRLFKRHKVIVSIGHTAATYREAARGIAAGSAHATHTFNRMRGLNQRDPGALGAVLVDERLTCEVIADGVHVHPACLKLLVRCKGLDKIALITDSTAAQAYPPKQRLGDVFRLKDGTLYGSALTLNKALKNIVQFLGLSLPQAVKLVTLNPAKVLGIDKHKGSIGVGKDADLVIFDQNFQVQLTMVEGKIVYRK